MKVVTLKNRPDLPVEGADRIEGWTGPVSRSRETIFQLGEFAELQLQRRQFQPGLHDRLAHPRLRSAAGCVPAPAWSPTRATREREINVGDVAHIKAGERHWHGAKADTTMGHITITLVRRQGRLGLIAGAARHRLRCGPPGRTERRDDEHSP